VQVFVLVRPHLQAGRQARAGGSRCVVPGPGAALIAGGPAAAARYPPTCTSLA
jgi:hypothetical protein